MAVARTRDGGAALLLGAAAAPLFLVGTWVGPRYGAVLSFSRHEWVSFLLGVRAGEFDELT